VNPSPFFSSLPMTREGLLDATLDVDGFVTRYDGILERIG
jgi:hypothetical protein